MSCNTPVNSPYIITNLKSESAFIRALQKLVAIPKHEEYMLINKYPPAISLPPILMTYPILTSNTPGVHRPVIEEEWHAEIVHAIVAPSPPPPSAYSDKDTEGEVPTGVENITKREKHVKVPWFPYDTLQEGGAWRDKNKDGKVTCYMHYCDGNSLYRPGEERVYKTRGYMIRRGYSVEDVTNYWCNSCGFTTNENETTYLDMLAL